MSERTPERALAHLLGTLVRDHDDADLFADLVRDCAALLPADAAAVLVRDSHHGLELLSSTSHRATELELYQAQVGAGPCAEAARTGEAVSAVGAADITARWPDVGRAIVDAGFLSVHAFPMVWHGRPLGGLNVFSNRPEPMTPASLVLAQNFADVAALSLVQPLVLSDADLSERVGAALRGRIVVEQAKGVLAETLGVDMGTAYDDLVHRALENGSTLSETARAVVRDAHLRRSTTGTNEA
ncbi:GAF and ANTAR domain-containing protein [uncultured Cellulomonas sp.]|uniref:GAF and ANTAR domain-containing protein n=1 Tax=uncultured Cellulomonas sp. TaxID=189682 RepID=UPI0028E38A06|nr:GAF and ANTAR domain-containing protein [uncultured Cellulomonas sp.]